MNIDGHLDLKIIRILLRNVLGRSDDKQHDCEANNVLFN